MIGAVLKLQRAATDRALARVADDELVALVAAERAVADSRVMDTHVSGSPSRLATKAQLAEALALSARTIEAMTADGRIPAEAVVRAGRRVRYDLARIVDALRGKAAVVPESRATAWARRGANLRVVGSEP